jgi:hypothetical protein
MYFGGDPYIAPAPLAGTYEGKSIRFSCTFAPNTPPKVFEGRLRAAS